MTNPQRLNMIIVALDALYTSEHKLKMLYIPVEATYTQNRYNLNNIAIMLEVPSLPLTGRVHGPALQCM